MKCPIDDETLIVSERNGVEIDYCPKCRGVWLDRGELDKIIDRAGEEFQRRPMPQFEERRDYGEYGERGERGEYGERGGYGSQKPYKKKRESFLSDLFDF